ncbi:hypothetical protein ACOME3_008832 [Neoechinorhynchus agilis]
MMNVNCRMLKFPSKYICVEIPDNRIVARQTKSAACLGAIGLIVQLFLQRHKSRNEKIDLAVKDGCGANRIICDLAGSKLASTFAFQLRGLNSNLFLRSMTTKRFQLN